MSYCRWSSDNFRCDLYCYEDAGGGWTTHVAGARYRDPRQARAIVHAESGKAALARAEAAKMDPIGGPFDGQTFNDPTLEAFKARLLELRAAGYRFPDYVLEDVDAEIAEQDRGQP
jgi:hypothetical protein